MSREVTTKKTIHLSRTVLYTQPAAIKRVHGTPVRLKKRERTAREAAALKIALAVCVLFVCQRRKIII